MMAHDQDHGQRRDTETAIPLHPSPQKQEVSGPIRHIAQRFQARGRHAGYAFEPGIERGNAEADQRPDHDKRCNQECQTSDRQRLVPLHVAVPILDLRGPGAVRWFVIKTSTRLTGARSPIARWATAFACASR